MKLRRQPQPPRVSDGPPPGERGLDFAWRTHSAITDWTAKVDAKASIVLSLSGALLGFFIALSAQGRLLAHLEGWRLVVGRVGLGFVSAGVLLSAMAVLPRLYRRKTKQSWKNNYVYFGHLRHWDPAKLKKRLLNQTLDEQLDVLALQLVNTSKIAWRKHLLVQLAMFSLFVGVVLVTFGVVWPR